MHIYLYASISCKGTKQQWFMNNTLGCILAAVVAGVALVVVALTNYKYNTRSHTRHLKH